MGGKTIQNTAQHLINSNKSVAYTILTCAVLFLGISIGYFVAKEQLRSDNVALPNHASRREKRAACQVSNTQTSAAKTFSDRSRERYNRKYACVNSRDECWTFGLPRNYIAYHLNGKSIKIDGKLDDEAWNEIPWSEHFVDIRSDIYPKPRFETKFKMRWDDENLYIGVLLQEKDLWATHKSHDTKLWTENGLSFLIDVDGSLFNYKQIEVNVLGTVTDLLMFKSYYDARGRISYDVNWESNAVLGVHTNGTINKVGDEDKYWSAEIAIPFKTLADRANRSQAKPLDDEVWFFQVARSEQNLVSVNGHYEKAPNSSATWWTWQPVGAVNLHLQDRWGLIQFKRDLTDRKFSFDKWHIYKALFDTKSALRLFKARNGVYTPSLEELDLPPYLFSSICVETPELRLTKNNSRFDFDVAVKSKLLSRPPSYIRSDRFVVL